MKLPGRRCAGLARAEKKIEEVCISDKLESIYIYITSLASLLAVRTSGSPVSGTFPFWPLGSPLEALEGSASGSGTPFLCYP